MFTLKVSGRGRVERPRDQTKASTINGFSVIAIQFPFQPAALCTCWPYNPEGKRVKTVPHDQSKFSIAIQNLCVHSSANFTSELVYSREGEGEQKGRQEFSSRSFASPLLPSFHCQSTIGQRTVLKWISIFPGVDLIKREPDFRDGNIVHENWESFARNIKAFFEVREKEREKEEVMIGDKWKSDWCKN